MLREYVPNPPLDDVSIDIIENNIPPPQGEGARVEAGVRPRLRAGEEHDEQDEHRNKQYVKHLSFSFPHLD